MSRTNTEFSLSGVNAQTQDSGANAAQTLTRTARAGMSHYITAIEVSISGSAAANDITIQLQDGSTTVWKEIIGSASTTGERAGIVFNQPVKLTTGNAANLVVSAGGAGVVTSANMAGFTA